MSPYIYIENSVIKSNIYTYIYILVYLHKSASVTSRTDITHSAVPQNKANIKFPLVFQKIFSVISKYWDEYSMLLRVGTSLGGICPTSRTCLPPGAGLPPT